MIADKYLINNRENCDSSYMVGILAVDEPGYPHTGDSQSAVTTQKNSNCVMFYIKPLSDDPEPIVDLDNRLSADGKNTLYIGIDTYMSSSFKPPEYKNYADTRKKIDIMKQILKNKIIIFRPKLNIYHQGVEGDQVFKNLNIVAIEDLANLKYDTLFVPIPVSMLSEKEFEDRLLHSKCFTLRSYNHAMKVPEFIICGEYMYSNLNSLERDESSGRDTWIVRQSEGIKKIKVSQSNFDKGSYVRGTETLIFLDQDYIQKKLIPQLDNSYEEVVASIEILEEQQSETTCQIENCNASDEYLFLENLKQYTKFSEGLCYDYNDLINFHVCVKTNQLTIISGMSGTGKTRLACAYADNMNLKNGDNLLILPISPSYTEPGDVLGYLGANGLYVPAETGLVDFLRHAEKEPNKMYMVLFDEMNLSQIEYWYSPFISLLELKAEDRQLSLYSESTICHNCEKYPPNIKIGDNVFFIGTVNVDETTKDFSDRLLDRANVITTTKMSFIRYKDEQDNKEIFKKEDSIEVLRETFKSWVNTKQPLDAFEKAEIDLFDNLHQLIQKYDHQKGFSFRALKSIGNYINNIPCDLNGKKMISKADAIDLQIKQRILTKIKGTEEQFDRLIGKISGSNDEPLHSELYDLFNSEKAQAISHFTITKEEIKRKAKELNIYGYSN